MDNRIKKGQLILLVCLSCFIFWNCSKGETIYSVQKNQTPDAVQKNTKDDVDAKEQNSISSETDVPCEKYVLEKITKQKVNDVRIIKVESFDFDDKDHSPNLKKWLQTSDKEELKIFELQMDKKKALIFGSFNISATGLAASLENWYIQQNNNSSTTFQSLSENQNLIFSDVDGLIHYYSILYSSEFLLDRDWDNLTVNLLHYKINLNGESQLVNEERNVKCD